MSIPTSNENAAAPAAPAVIDRRRPFQAKLVERRLLNPGSDKIVSHLVFDITGSGITYKCGDALGVWPRNGTEIVGQLIDILALDGTAPVLLPKEAEPVPLRDALLYKLSLRMKSLDALRAFRERTPDAGERDALDIVLNGGDAVQRAWLDRADVLNLARAGAAARFTPQEFAALLRPLAPRLYSIASSPARDPNRVELTVAAVHYKHVPGNANDAAMNAALEAALREAAAVAATGDTPALYSFAVKVVALLDSLRERRGVCSTYLAERVMVGTPVPVFPHVSHFAPPDDHSAPVIMVGPGTGIAPFRGFLQEREARGATGGNWLFFGDRHEATDFLYKDELLAWRDSGLLARLSLAWSRDQREKVYVHHLMRRDGAELWRWLEDGAYFYICGNASNMAKDVEAALLAIIAEHGNLAPDAAADYLAALKREGRYQRDVY
ncbi:MAG: hypothetical protein LBR07_06635 [Puniceicoccales bacterium]|jgi:sulfite reductase (NADPH) flavoprotein alpha-component|nr:hypothetical protein [Puniceicoccales bacterium]